ncbi:hypothetical protein E0493_11175 [Roseomonas sp. M0104]|uniref:REase associating with pPIWI RE domain-containing protein n=1 Tax=Teichococcus coralli TaxID=2545983 RepID=A0A845BCQ7_9PROT|nr:hypothetical protein [Pseudoroseomonas coralli]MXP63906.1 hypothetical protein [Pseudoroseomonas coralli]
MLARGLLEAHQAASEAGSVLHQDSSMPQMLRRGLALLSRISVEEGAPDLGASLHVMNELATRPMAGWGLQAFRAPFKYADVVLVDGEAGVATEDCRELAREASGGEIAAAETIYHERLREAVAKRPRNQRDAAYEALRSFVVRNPAIPQDELIRFIARGGHTASLQVVQAFYRPVPQTALFGTRAHRCAHCHSLLWPDRDKTSYPDGRCRIRQCRLAHPTSELGAVIEDPSSWRIATPAVTAYWVGPGLDEVNICDALLASGRKAVLYPQQDAADVGVDGLDIGIDVKTYASPVTLGNKLTRDTGRLGMFARRFLAVPDDKLRNNRDYLRQLRESYRGKLGIEFVTVSQVIEELSA